jgi:hypothetical protein
MEAHFGDFASAARGHLCVVVSQRGQVCRFERFVFVLVFLTAFLFSELGRQACLHLLL